MSHCPNTPLKSAISGSESDPANLPHTCPRTTAVYGTDWPSASNHQTLQARRDNSHDKAEGNTHTHTHDRKRGNVSEPVNECRGLLWDQEVNGQFMISIVDIVPFECNFNSLLCACRHNVFMVWLSESNTHVKQIPDSARYRATSLPVRAAAARHVCLGNLDQNRVGFFLFCLFF